MIRAVLFDFGGVLAEEGFRTGLHAIATGQGIDPARFFASAESLIYETGYVLGTADEAAYWQAVRAATGIQGTDEVLREQILSRFVLREEMLGFADRLREAGYFVGILSDQTDWLDELDRRRPFFGRFDRVLNSFHLGKGKRDITLFTDVCAMLGFQAGQVLFLDDNPGHVQRAGNSGLHAVQCSSTDGCIRGAEGLLGPARRS